MLIVLLIYTTMLLFCFLSVAKVCVDCNNHLLIIDAIALYWADVRENHDWSTLTRPTYEVDLDDLEDSNKTFWRLWDWSYKRILPKEKFAIIEPYIEMAKTRK